MTHSILLEKIPYLSSHKTRTNITEINGPLILSIQDEESTLKRELHIKFKPAFVQSEVSERIRQLDSCMKKLDHALRSLNNDDSDRQGIDTVYQICENQRDHTRADEIDLEEIIVLEIQPTISISSYITGHSSIN